MKGLTLWGPPTITRKMDFGVVEISIDIEAGIKIDNNASLNASAGQREDMCKGEDCWFGAIDSRITVTPKATLEAILCEETFWTSRQCQGLTFTPLGVDISFRAQVTYNEASCQEGFKGSVNLGKIEAFSQFQLGVPGSSGYKFTYEIYAGGQF